MAAELAAILQDEKAASHRFAQVTAACSACSSFWSPPPSILALASDTVPLGGKPQWVSLTLHLSSCLLTASCKRVTVSHQGKVCHWPHAGG